MLRKGLEPEFDSKAWLERRKEQEFLEISDLNLIVEEISLMGKTPSEASLPLGK
jgi:hypothetical protein